MNKNQTLKMLLILQIQWCTQVLKYSRLRFPRNIRKVLRNLEDYCSIDRWRPCYRVSKIQLSVTTIRSVTTRLTIITTVIVKWYIICPMQTIIIIKDYLLCSNNTSHKFRWTRFLPPCFKIRITPKLQKQNKWNRSSRAWNELPKKVSHF